MRSIANCSSFMASTLLVLTEPSEWAHGLYCERGLARVNHPRCREAGFMRTIICALALLISTLISTLLSTTAAAAQERQQPDQGPVIITTGTATLQRAPDVAFISIAVESRAKSPREAQQQNATAMTAITKKLTDLSIPAEARRTLGIRLEQEYDTPGG